MTISPRTRTRIPKRTRRRPVPAVTPRHAARPPDPADEPVSRADAVDAVPAPAVADRIARELHTEAPVARPGRLLGNRPRGSRRAPARRAYLTAALLRCLLYLGPLSLAAAAADPLSTVAWPVPLTALLLGWAAAQALTSTGVTVARRAGPSAAARLVGGGFAAAAGLWCALVWVSPQSLLGPDRGLALVVGLGGLATLATVTAALVTRAEAAVVVWSLPCWALGVATLAGWPTGTLLPAAIVVALVRAFRPVAVPGGGRRPVAPAPARPEVRRGAGYLIIGASQAICVGMLWQAGPSGSTVPFWLPLLIAVPILEALIGWHTDQVEAGLDAAENGADFQRHVRGITLITVAGLLPPFAVGVALTLAAYQVAPYRVAADQMAGDLVTGDLVTAEVILAQADVLALAGGTLLGGVFAITFLLAARGRTAVAAVLAATPPLVTAAYPLLPLPAAGPLPDAVAVLAATHLAGLLVVALTAADHRRTM